MTPLTITTRIIPHELVAESSPDLAQRLIAYGRLCYIKHHCPHRIASRSASFAADLEQIGRELRNKHMVQVYFTDTTTTLMWANWWEALGLPEKATLGRNRLCTHKWPHEMGSLIGLSLGRCVADIALGWVDVQDVEKVFTGTQFTTAEDRAAVMTVYSSRIGVWCNLPTAVGVFHQLEAQGKIVQARNLGLEPPHIPNGSWVVLSVPDVATRLWEKEPFVEAFAFGNEPQVGKG